jgi:hypothetical protein
MGWTIAAAYLVAAGLCAAYARRADRVCAADRFRLHRPFWWTLAAIMLLLGINKQLDLHTLLTSVGRQLARSQGWYTHRQTFQMWFVAGIAIAGLILLIWLGWTFRRMRRQYALPLFGILFLFAFVVVRAASFHHVDAILGWRPGGVRMYWVLELGGIACIAAAALMGIFRCCRPTAKTTHP